jgi:uncharacterized surface protein with fasciclin (FAS1) repeats
MMKRYVLFILLIVCGYRASAQAVDTTFRSPEKELATFYKAVNAAGMDGIYNNTPVTIFAPENKAFGKLPQLDSLLQNKTALSALLNDHVITGKFTAKDITALIHQNNGSTTLTSLSGRKYTVKINANRNLVLADDSGAAYVIEAFNITHGNAVIFLINAVIPAKQ